MKRLLAFGFALAQAATPAPPTPAPSTPRVEPWNGSLADGLAEMKRLAEAEKTAEALAIADRLLEPDSFSRWRDGAISKSGWKKTAVLAAGPAFDAIGLGALTEPERATVHHARGVVMAESADEKRVEAVSEFEKARALAGPGDLRLDATYDAGWAWLAQGEALRAKIPEIANAGSPATTPAAPPPTQPSPPGAAGAAPPAPDPLELARAAYLQARTRFVDRLKLEASDSDTRANAELTQRRLRELEEIAKKREEEKKKQEQQQKDKDQKDSKDQDSKDSKKDEQQKKDDEKKDSDSKQDEPPKPDEKKPDEKKPDEKKPEDRKDAQPQDPSESKDPKKDAQPKPSQEELLTREEVMRLLDILKNREAEGKKLQEQLRNARRVSVKKDW